MSQRARNDEPGSIHHVMNRALSRRTAFEGRDDVRRFLAALARAVRAGWFQVHAYSVLTTHFHLLVTSPEGEMWRGMRRAQNEYVRWFNRRRGRGGPLFRGRFRSKRVRSSQYLRTLVHYIDQNAPDARLVDDAADYPYGSARIYRGGFRVPPWLETGLLGLDALAGVEPETLSADVVEVIERRHGHACSADDPLDDLVAAAPAAVRRWMVRKARLADGTAPGLPMVSGAAIDSALDEVAILTMPGRQADELRCGLLRTLAGWTLAEIAARCEVSRGAALGRVQRHSMRLGSDREYAAVAADATTQAMAAVWGERASRQSVTG